MFKHELRPGKGANRNKKRLGRGTGSGLGTTAGKGHKGQKARAGAGFMPGFEGGQMPMVRRVPKRGFSNARFATVYEIVNLGDIDAVYSDGQEVNLESLKLNALVHGNKDGVKILGDGEFSKKLTFTVNKVSASAEEKIKAAGGVINILPAFKEKEEVRERKEKKAASRAAKIAKKNK